VKSIITQNADETLELGRKIGRVMGKGAVLCLEGPLGSGKTLLTKGIASSLDIKEEITSPTFTIISAYKGKFDLYHMDLYRIRNEEELYDLGLEEILEGDGIAVIEWAEKLGALRPASAIDVSFRLIDPERREITIKGIDL
jgi:tRNA threonylcarbamoyladenosine biosynthesis protein TsaE